MRVRAKVEASYDAAYEAALTGSKMRQNGGEGDEKKNIIGVSGER